MGPSGEGGAVGTGRDLSLRGSAALFVIPAYAGIHLFYLCFYFLIGSRK